MKGIFLKAFWVLFEGFFKLRTKAQIFQWQSAFLQHLQSEFEDASFVDDDLESEGLIDEKPLKWYLKEF